MEFLRHLFTVPNFHFEEDGPPPLDSRPMVLTVGDLQAVAATVIQDLMPRFFAQCHHDGLKAAYGGSSEIEFWRTEYPGFGINGSVHCGKCYYDELDENGQFVKHVKECETTQYLFDHYLLWLYGKFISDAANASHYSFAADSWHDFEQGKLSLFTQCHHSVDGVRCDQVIPTHSVEWSSYRDAIRRNNFELSGGRFYLVGTCPVGWFRGPTPFVGRDVTCSYSPSTHEVVCPLHSALPQYGA